SARSVPRGDTRTVTASGAPPVPRLDDTGAGARAERATGRHRSGRDRARAERRIVSAARDGPVPIGVDLAPWSDLVIGFSREHPSRIPARCTAVACVLAALVSFDPPSLAYGVLTHEALIDAAWTDHIEPLLRERYPGTSPEALAAARGYAYGGCL